VRLRRNFQHAPQDLIALAAFLLVLTGLPTLVPKLNEARTFTERMFHTLVLDRLSDEDARAAITRPIEITRSTLTFAETAIQRIMAESKGYPFLIQYICKEVFDAWVGKMTVGAVPSVSMTEIVAKLDQDFFAPRWNRATDRQQIFMQVIATLPNSNRRGSYCFAAPLLANFIQRQAWDAATRRVPAS
jgi:hypothetical protein